MILQLYSARQRLLRIPRAHTVPEHQRLIQPPVAHRALRFHPDRLLKRPFRLIVPEVMQQVQPLIEPGLSLRRRRNRKMAIADPGHLHRRRQPLRRGNLLHRHPHVMPRHTHLRHRRPRTRQNNPQQSSQTPTAQTTTTTRKKHLAKHHQKSSFDKLPAPVARQRLSGRSQPLTSLPSRATFIWSTPPSATRPPKSALCKNKPQNSGVLFAPKNRPSSVQLYHAIHHHLTTKTPQQTPIHRKNPPKNAENHPDNFSANSALTPDTSPSTHRAGY